MVKLLNTFNFACMRCDTDHAIKALNALVKDNMEHTYVTVCWVYWKSTMENCFAMVVWEAWRLAKHVSMALDRSECQCVSCFLICSVSSGGSVSTPVSPLSPPFQFYPSLAEWSIHRKSAAITALLQCNEKKEMRLYCLPPMGLLDAYAWMLQVVWWFVVNIENEMNQASGAMHVIQRYMSANQKCM